MLETKQPNKCSNYILWIKIKRYPAQKLQTDYVII